MKAQEIMTRDPACVTPDTNVREAVQLMQKEDVGLIPVVESESSRRLVGVITDRDVAIRVVGDGRPADGQVREFMSESVHTAKEDEDVDAVMRLMGNEQIRRVPIVDERGGIVGIVSQADVAREGADAERVDRTLEKISKPGSQASGRKQ